MDVPQKSRFLVSRGFNILARPDLFQLAFVEKVYHEFFISVYCFRGNTHLQYQARYFDAYHLGNLELIREVYHGNATTLGVYIMTERTSKWHPLTVDKLPSKSTLQRGFGNIFKSVNVIGCRAFNSWRE